MEAVEARGLEAGQRRGARIPCEGSELHRPFVGVVEALRSHPRGSQRVIEVFTINTEIGEIACVLHLKIPNIPTRGATQAQEGGS
jgi:hypothetical protein